MLFCCSNVVSTKCSPISANQRAQTANGCPGGHAIWWHMHTTENLRDIHSNCFLIFRCRQRHSWSQVNSITRSTTSKAYCTVPMTRRIPKLSHLVTTSPPIVSLIRGRVIDVYIVFKLSISYNYKKHFLKCAIYSHATLMCVNAG